MGEQLGKCPRCRGRLLQHFGEVSCICCGYEAGEAVPVPSVTEEQRCPKCQQAQFRTTSGFRTHVALCGRRMVTTKPQQHQGMSISPRVIGYD